MRQADFRRPKENKSADSMSANHKLLRTITRSVPAPPKSDNDAFASLEKLV
jgi:hypothetical protein